MIITRSQTLISAETMLDQITVAGVHARTVAESQRLQFQHWVGTQAIRPGVVALATCHRVELFGADLDQRIEQELPTGGYLLHGEAAVHHVMRVAVGLDSAVVGEDQILHQLRESIVAARGRGALGPLLEQLCAVALRAGRRARSWRTGPSRSLADRAIAALQAHTDRLEERPILIVGAGEMGRLAVRGAGKPGGGVWIASRNDGHAAELARASGNRAVPFDPGSLIRETGGVIVALRGPWMISPETCDAIVAARIPVVDLSVPSAAPDALRALGPRFVSADALARPASSADRRTTRRLEAAADEAVETFRSWLDRRATSDAIRSLRERSEQERAAVIAQFWERVGGIGPEERAQIEAMSRQLADRLLRDPIERLSQDVDGQRERAARDLFGL